MPVRLRLTAVAVAALMVPANAEAAEPSLPGIFTGNIALSNDYVFRGYTRTSGDASVQGGLEWDSNVGAYLGTWGSNINTGAATAGSMELDVYGGVRGAVGNLGYDVGLIGYLHPGTPKALGYNFWEGKVGVSYNFPWLSIAAGVNYSPDFYGNLDDGFYWSGKLLVPFGYGFSIDGTMGYSDLKPAGASYLDWSVGASFAFDWFTTDFRYSDTDQPLCTDLCDRRFVVKFSRAF